MKIQKTGHLREGRMSEQPDNISAIQCRSPGMAVMLRPTGFITRHNAANP